MCIVYQRITKTDITTATRHPVKKFACHTGMAVTVQSIA